MTEDPRHDEVDEVPDEDKLSHDTPSPHQPDGDEDDSVVPKPPVKHHG